MAEVGLDNYGLAEVWEVIQPAVVIVQNSEFRLESDTRQSPERQGRIFHGGKTAGVKRRKTPGRNQDVTLGACEVDVKLEGKLLSPNYMAFLPLF